MHQNLASPFASVKTIISMFLNIRGIQNSSKTNTIKKESRTVNKNHQKHRFKALQQTHLHGFGLALLFYLHLNEWAPQSSLAQDLQAVSPRLLLGNSSKFILSCCCALFSSKSLWQISWQEYITKFGYANTSSPKLLKSRSVSKWIM